MKFGEYILQHQYAPWATEYLQYDRIKKVIRETHDEEAVDQFLQAEFVKIKDFLSRKINALQYQLQLIEHQEPPQLSFTSSGQLGDDLVYPLYDLHDLMLYLDLCLSGFKKLVKSYTKNLIQTKSILANHDFIIKSLDKYYAPLNQLLVRMAHIKNSRSPEIRKKNKMKDLPPTPLARDLDSPLPPLPQNNDDNDGDRVITSYYWVHPSQVFHLKTLLLIYAKLDHHHPLSTVYFDDNQWSVYNSHLDEQTKSVDSIECTWPGFYHAHNGNIQLNHFFYHDKNVTSIKRHKLSWAAFNSCLRDMERTTPLPPAKDKPGIRLSTANASISNGDLAMATALIVEPRNISDASEQQLDQCLRDRIQQQQWQPRATWTCERTTFTPMTNDCAIDIHVDTNIVMKEVDSSFGGQQQQQQQQQSGPSGTRHRHTGLSMMTVVQHLKKGDNTTWNQQYDNDDYSLGRTPPADTLKQSPTQPPGSKQQQWPGWLKRLSDGCDWIHAVPRFSMYIHLISRLYGDHVPLLPWWLGYFDRSWLVSTISSDYGLSRSTSLQPLLHGAALSSLLTHPTYNKATTTTGKNHMAVDMGYGEQEDDDDDGDMDDGTGKDNKMLLPKSTTPNIVSTTTTITPSMSVPAMTTSAKTAINNMVKKTTQRIVKPRWTTTTTTTATATATTRLTKMKMKVEPKVFFANERTFLSWLQFCALLLTVSLNMINFGGQDDYISRVCGGMFIIITILLALYALAKYEFRAWNLLTRSSRYRFDDVYGPAILCFLLVVAMLINFGLRLNSPSPPG